MRRLVDLGLAADRAQPKTAEKVGSKKPEKLASEAAPKRAAGRARAKELASGAVDSALKKVEATDEEKAVRKTKLVGKPSTDRLPRELSSMDERPRLRPNDRR